MIIVLKSKFFATSEVPEELVEMLMKKNNWTRNQAVKQARFIDNTVSSSVKDSIGENAAKVTKEREAILDAAKKRHEGRGLKFGTRLKALGRAIRNNPIKYGALGAGVVGLGMGGKYLYDKYYK